MPGLNLYHPDPIDTDWVREMLLEFKTRCEVLSCGNQAEYHVEGKKTLAYICEQHHKLFKDRPALGVKLCAELWERFQDGFNFIRQVEASGGKLLADLIDLEGRIVQQERQQVKNEKKAVTQARAEIRNALKQGKVGAPDDELATARGAQSPPREPLQLIFRAPELEPLDPVTLPPIIEPDSLLQVRLL